MELEKSSYTFLWSNFQTHYTIEMNITSLIKFNHILWNKINNIIAVSRNNTISCFHSDKDLEDDLQKGKQFLDNNFREKFIEEVETNCKKHKEFFKEIRKVDLSRLSDQELLEWLIKATDKWSLIISYFRASQARPTHYLQEELKKYFNKLPGKFDIEYE